MLTYTELCKRTELLSRFRYAKLDGAVGAYTFRSDRYLNQRFYASPEWKTVRDAVLIRDRGMDLGLDGWPIMGRALVHHMNPIEVEDLVYFNPEILNPEYLITVSHQTHNAIHFSDESQLPRVLAERRPGDTTLWTKEF